MLPHTQDKTWDLNKNFSFLKHDIRNYFCFKDILTQEILTFRSWTFGIWKRLVLSMNELKSFDNLLFGYLGPVVMKYFCNETIDFI